MYVPIAAVTLWFRVLYRPGQEYGAKVGGKKKTGMLISGDSARMWKVIGHKMAKVDKAQSLRV
jgi:hypothetical protein